MRYILIFLLYSSFVLGQTKPVSEGTFNSFTLAQGLLSATKLNTSTYTTNRAADLASLVSLSALVGTNASTQATRDAAQDAVTAGKAPTVHTHTSSSITDFVATARASITTTGVLSYTSGVLSIPQASSGVSGYLNSGDWATFAGKLDSTRTLGITDKKPTYLADIASLTAFVRGNVTSVTVQDPARGDVFNYAATGYTVNNVTVFLAAGGGFWVRQYQSKLLISWGGAKGAGDETALIQAVLNIPASAYEFANSVNYSISSGLQLKYSNAEIIGNNATLVALSGFTASATMLSTKLNTLLSDVSAGITVTQNSPVITYPNASSLVAGKLLVITGGVSIASTPSAYNFGHLSQVTSLSAGAFTTSILPEQSFSASTATMFDPIDNIKVRDLNFNTGNNTLIRCITFNLVTNCHIVGGKFTGQGAEVAINVAGINCSVEKTQISGFNFFDNGLGYGIAVSGHNTIARENEIGDCKHALTSSSRTYMSTGIWYFTNFIHPCLPDYAPVDFHANCVGSGAIDNTIHSISSSTINVRSSRIDLKDNTIYNNYSAGIIKLVNCFEGYEGNSRMLRNSFFVTAPSGTDVRTIYVDNNTNAKLINNVSIEGNTLNGGAINFNTGTGANINIRGNTFSAIVGVLSSIDMNRSDNGIIENNTFISPYFLSAFNYSMNIQPNANGLLIRNNTFALANGNTSPQIRINSSNNQVIGNVVSTTSTTPTLAFQDFSTSKQNLFLGNKLINPTTLTSTESVYTALPAASAFFVDQVVSVLGSGIIKSYRCVKSAANTYIWVTNSSLQGSATYTPGTITTGSQISTTVTVTGVSVGDFARASFSNSLQGVRMWSEITSANTVTVYFRNDTGASVTLGSGTLSVRVD